MILRSLAALFPLLLTSAAAQAADDAAAALCRTNPAFSPAVIRAVLDAQLQKDHDPALDSMPPEQMTAETVEQGVAECAQEFRGNAALFRTIEPLQPADRQIAWDAYNDSCADHAASKADCVKAELQSARALKHMMATNQPPGARSLVMACQLVIRGTPTMVDWRSCVDAGLAVRAPADVAANCKTSVSWHVARTGAEAGRIVARCLSAGGGSGHPG